MNPHTHSLVPDGLFIPSDRSELTFAPLPPPTQDELEHLTTKIAWRLGKIARRRLGLEEQDPPLVEPDEALVHASVQESLRLPRVRALEVPTGQLCARVDGFTLHAGRWVPAHDRRALERLCQYGLRPPFSTERFSIDAENRVRYRLRRPWPGPGGSTELVLDPLALLRRLASLIPAPYSNLVRYHGIFSNRAKHRPLLPAPTADETEQPQVRARRVPWAQLLRRVLDVDALACARCAAPMLVLAFLTDPTVVRGILEHLGLPSSPPPLAPPRLWWEQAPDEPVEEWDTDEPGRKAPRSPQRAPP